MTVHMLQISNSSSHSSLAKTLFLSLICGTALAAQQASAQTAVDKSASPKAEVGAGQSTYKNWSTKEITTAPPPREMTETEKAVVRRAGERWELLAKGDYKAAYEFLSASSKAFKPYPAFEAEASGSTLRDLKPTRAECDKDGRCSVTLAGRAAIQQPKVGMLGVPVLTQEVWSVQASGEAVLILR